MRIAIAGANSFIGKRMINILASKEEHEVIAVVREGSQSKDFLCSINNVKVVECNMENYDRIGEFTGDGDVFINYAWNGSRGATRMDHNLQKFNYKCAVAAAKSMADTGYKLLISAGSQAEYGQIDGVITEETVPMPNTEYGKFKLEIFETMNGIASEYNIKFIEPRYFSLYGPGDYDKTLIMQCVRKMMNNEDVLLNPCTQLWDYLYVDDACYALLSLIYNNVNSGVYNFASGLYRPLKDFVLDIKKSINSKSVVEFDDPEKYSGLIINLQPRIDKLLASTKGWHPTTPFINGVKEIVKDMTL